MERDKHKSAQALAIKRSQPERLFTLSQTGCSSLNHLSTSETVRYPYTGEKVSYVCRQQVLNIIGFKLMIQCNIYYPYTILACLPNFRTSANRIWLLFHIRISTLISWLHIPEFPWKTFTQFCFAGICSRCSEWLHMGRCVPEAWLCNHHTALLLKTDEKPDFLREEDSVHLPKMPLNLYYSANLWHLIYILNTTKAVRLCTLRP